MRKCSILHQGHDFQVFPVFYKSPYKSYDTLARVYLICKNCGYTIEKNGIDWWIPEDTERRNEEIKKELKQNQKHLIKETI